MALNLTKEQFEKRKVVQEGETEISERSYNLVLGGVLLWGFLLNYLMVRLLGPFILRFAAEIHPMVLVLGYLALAFAGSALVARPNALTSFLGFNLIAAPIGVIVCIALQGYAMATIRTAILYTAAVTALFMALGALYPQFFLKLGRVLAVALLASLVVELAGALILRTSFDFMNWIGVGIFSLYIGYDWARANTCAPTLDNAVDLAANLYLDIINLFLRILSLLGKRRR